LTAFLIPQDGGTVETSKVAELLKQIDPNKDSVVTDGGEIVHEPLESDTGAEIVSL
jgi:hypothetical protein